MHNKLFILVFLGFLFFTTSAFADEWSVLDSGLEIVYAGVLTVDYTQTLYSARHPYEYGEMNSILKDHMRKETISAYFATALVGHAAIAYILPKPYRTIWQSVWIGVEAQTVYNNQKITGAGISLHF